jgi:hypothetical protein
MSRPAVKSGACRPLDAAWAIRTRCPPFGAPSRSTAKATATACWSARPARGDRSARSVPIRKKPRQKVGLKGYETHRSPANYPGPRFDSCAHFVARRSCLPGNRQVSRKALLQRAARPNFFPSRGNTLAQTLQPFGTRCQPCCCSRSSPVPSVVSATESNPTRSVSSSPLPPARCHPMQSGERFPI